MTDHPKNQTPNSQSGVTLLLSILILAGLTLITVAVGAFAIQELRSARAAAITEPAIAAAQSGGEAGLWAIKRSGTLSTDCTNPTTQILSDNSLVDSCESYTEATFDVNSTSPFVFYLYDPTNMNGDTDLSGYPYSSMVVDYLTGSGSLQINIARLDGTTTGLSPAAPSPIFAGQNQTVSISPVATGTEGRMKITLTLSSGDATVTVNTDRGMPTFPTVDASGCSSNVPITNCNSSTQEVYSRRINVTVPQ